MVDGEERTMLFPISWLLLEQTLSERNSQSIISQITVLSDLIVS